MRNTVLLPFRLSFKIYFGLVFFLSLLVLYPLFFLFLRILPRYKVVFKLKRFWALLLQMAILSPTHIKRAKEEIKTVGPKLIIANHTSYLDIILMYRLFKEPFIFIGKAELLKWPLFSIFFKTMDVAVDRTNPRSAARSLAKARQRMQEGFSVAIFPEGTISLKAPEMRRFKGGAFKLAVEEQVPIVPVCFHSNYKVMSDPDHKHGKAGPDLLRVSVLPEVQTKGKTSEDLILLRDVCFSQIQNALENGNK